MRDRRLCSRDPGTCSRFGNRIMGDVSAAICFAASTLCWCVAFRVSTVRSNVLVVLGCVLAAMSVVGVAAFFGPIVLKVCLLFWNVSVAIVWLQEDSPGVAIER
jgi:hypothetical protein